MLTIGAVPFTLGPLDQMSSGSGGGGVASRRRRHPAGGNHFMPEQQQQPQPDLRQILSLENAGFVAVVLNEAGQGLAGSASRVGDDERRHLAADTPAAPPNS